MALIGSVATGCIQLPTWPVVRIAVAPSEHSKGIGSQLISHCEQQLASTCHWFGASFGANATLLKFWQNAGFDLLKLGFAQDKATAEHAALMVKPLLTMIY